MSTTTASYDKRFLPYAEAALGAYARAVGWHADAGPDQAIVACVASLLHYAAANGCEPSDMIERAKEMYDTEA